MVCAEFGNEISNLRDKWTLTCTREWPTFYYSFHIFFPELFARFLFIRLLHKTCNSLKVWIGWPKRDSKTGRNDNTIPLYRAHLLVIVNMNEVQQYYGYECGCEIGMQSMQYLLVLSVWVFQCGRAHIKLTALFFSFIFTLLRFALLAMVAVLSIICVRYELTEWWIRK